MGSVIKKNIFLIGIILILLGTYDLFARSKIGIIKPVVRACQEDAKICPDGSSVGRTGPECQFAPCPITSVNLTKDWKTYSDPKTGISFKYPETLGTKYIDAFDWPPKLQILTQDYSCTTAGSINDRTGETTEITINGNKYCQTKIMQGAAGSIYTQYAYAFPRDNKEDILTFTIRSVQCGNYPDPEKTQCEAERANFILEPIVDLIAKSISNNP